MEEQLQSTESASTESSLSTPEQTAAPEQSATATQEAGANQTKETANTPFHEHPRWKELVEQRNQFQAQMQEMQKQLKEYNSRIPEPAKAETPEQKMLKRLESVDPEFAGLMKGLVDRLPRVDQIEQQMAAEREASSRQSVANQMTSLHEQYKVPAEHRDMYRALIQQKAVELGSKIEELPQVYKAVHDNVSKLFDTAKRAERESYLSSKKADSSIPAAPARGTPARPAAKKPEFSADRDEAKKQVIGRVMESLRSGKTA